MTERRTDIDDGGAHDDGDFGLVPSECGDDTIPRTDGSEVGEGRTRRALLSTTAVLATAVSGCLTNPWGPESTATSNGDSQSTPDGATDETAPSPNPPENETDDGGAANSDDAGTPPLEREPSQVVEVAPDGFRFDPASFEIESGETVRWTWMDSGHNIRVRTKPDGSDWEGTPGTASDTYDEGYEHAHTFDAPGEYRYFCAPHQTLGLEGSFTVR